MTFKKKLTSMALSIGLLFGTIGSVSADTTASGAFPDQDFWGQLKAVHDKLTDAPNGGEKAKVRTARDNIGALQRVDWERILDGTLDNLGLIDAGDQQTFFALLKETGGLPYSADGSTLEKIRTTTAYHDLLQKIATKAHVGADDLTVTDFVNFAGAVQEALYNKVTSLSVGQLLRLYSDETYRNDLAVEALNKVLDDNSTAPLVKVFRHYYKPEDKNDITGAISRFLAVPGVKDGSLALFSAYLRVKGISTNPGSGGGGGGGGGTGGTITPPAVDPNFSQLTKSLDELKAKITNATGEELQKLIDQAVNEASKAVNNLNNYDAATMKTVTNGQATITIDGTKLLANIENIAKIKKQLKELLDAAKAADQMPELNLLVDIDFAPEAKVAFNVPKSVVDKAIAAGLDGVKLAFGYSNVTIPLGGAISDTLGFNVTMKGAKEANLVTDLKVLSQVFDFELIVGGNQLSEFAKPIRVAFPLNLEGNIDQELISVAKIIDGGKLQFHGGVLAGKEIVEPRDTLSSYVVVENKVNFSDIENVNAWAGRQIQVIAAKGIAEGKVEGKFSPNDPVTRAEFAKMLIRALNLEDAFATSNFRDVKADDWFAPYAGAAVKHGIIQGKAGNLFAPNATITRAEMATMIARALKTTKKLQDVSNPDTVIGTFSDANQIHASLKLGVAFATSKGLVKGNAGKFNPTSNASRAEAAVILYRMFNYKE